MALRYLVGEGERIPMGYAIAWRDFDTDRKVAYPLFLHLLLRWLRDARFWLMRVGRPGYREKIEQAAFLRGREWVHHRRPDAHEMGYKSGHDAGWVEGRDYGFVEAQTYYRSKMIAFAIKHGIELDDDA